MKQRKCPTPPFRGIQNDRFSSINELRAGRRHERTTDNFSESLGVASKEIVSTRESLALSFPPPFRSVFAIRQWARKFSPAEEIYIGGFGGGGNVLSLSGRARPNEIFIEKFAAINSRPRDISPVRRAVFRNSSEGPSGASLSIIRQLPPSFSASRESTREREREREREKERERERQPDTRLSSGTTV